MIIKSQAPCRISLFGGGTDLPDFYKKYGGMVINFAVNLRQHFTFYKDENMYENKDNFPHLAEPKFIYEIFNNYGIKGNKIKIQSECDAFLQGGLGTSAAAAVATLEAINKIKGEDNLIEDLVKKAWDAECQMGWYGGMQDQWASALGGGNIIFFQSDGKVKIQPIRRNIADEFSRGMVLIWTGERKSLSKGEKYHPNRQYNFRKLTKTQVEALTDIRDMAQQVIPYLMKCDYIKVGKLMDIYWKMKKKSNPLVTTDKIDKIYDQAMERGAIGGKLLGAGGGGYMLFIVEPVDREDFVQRMKRIDIDEVDFSIDYQGVETRRV